VAVCSLALVLVGCGASPMYLRGRVIDDVLEQPIAGAAVSVYEVQPPHARPRLAYQRVARRATTTNANGVFTIRYLHCFGTDYRFRVTHDGYEASDLSEREAGAIGGGCLVGLFNRRIMTTIRLQPSRPNPQTVP
jgi:hypothetical protein